MVFVEFVFLSFFAFFDFGGRFSLLDALHPTPFSPRSLAEFLIYVVRA